MKIYCTRENTNESLIYKFLGKDVWVKCLVLHHGFIYAKFISIFEDKRLVNYDYILDYVIEDTRDYSDYYIANSLLHNLCLPSRTLAFINDIDVMKSIQIYTTEELKHIAKEVLGI